MEFAAQWLSGPMFIVVGLLLGYFWWFGGYVFYIAIIPVSPLLVFSSLGLGAWLFKLGWIDRDVEAIMSFWKEEKAKGGKKSRSSDA